MTSHHPGATVSAPSYNMTERVLDGASSGAMSDHLNEIGWSTPPSPLRNILQEMRAVVAAAKSQEAFAAKDVASLKAEIEAFQKRLAFKRSGAPEGIDQHLESNHTGDKYNSIAYCEYAETQTLCCITAFQRLVRFRPYLCLSRILPLFCADAAQEPLSDDERIRMEVRVDQPEGSTSMLGFV